MNPSFKWVTYLDSEGRLLPEEQRTALVVLDEAPMASLPVVVEMTGSVLMTLRKHVQFHYDASIPFHSSTEKASQAPIFYSDKFVLYTRFLNRYEVCDRVDRHAFSYDGMQEEIPRDEPWCWGWVNNWYADKQEADRALKAWLEMGGAFTHEVVPSWNTKLERKYLSDLSFRVTHLNLSGGHGLDVGHSWPLVGHSKDKVFNYPEEALHYARMCAKAGVNTRVTEDADELTRPTHQYQLTLRTDEQGYGTRDPFQVVGMTTLDSWCPTATWDLDQGHLAHFDGDYFQVGSKFYALLEEAYKASLASSSPILGRCALPKDYGPEVFHDVPNLPEWIKSKAPNGQSHRDNLSSLLANNPGWPANGKDLVTGEILLTRTVRDLTGPIGEYSSSSAPEEVVVTESKDENESGFRLLRLHETIPHGDFSDVDLHVASGRRTRQEPKGEKPDASLGWVMGLVALSCLNYKPKPTRKEVMAWAESLVDPAEPSVLASAGEAAGEDEPDLDKAKLIE